MNWTCNHGRDRAAFYNNSMQVESNSREVPTASTGPCFYRMNA
jgi:hypothetical protein